MESPKPTILVKLKSQTICEKLNPTIDDPIVCLQENQLFSIFDFHIKFEITELFRHWGFKSQMLFIKAYPNFFFFKFRIPLFVEIFCVYFSSFKMMFNLRNWEICEFWKPLQSLNLQRNKYKKYE